MKLTLRKGFHDNWWIIERAEHDGREWIDGEGCFRTSARFSDADVEGHTSEMLALAMAIKARGNFSAKRCAVEVSDHAVFRSPRNSQTDGIVSLEDADALADEILAKLGGGK